MKNEKYFAEQKLTAWAVPCRFRLAGDPEFEIKVVAGDHKPYNDGAVKLTSRYLKWEVVIPENVVASQIDSLEESIEEEHKAHARRILDLNEKINDLRALPAPEAK